MVRGVFLEHILTSAKYARGQKNAIFRAESIGAGLTFQLNDMLLKFTKNCPAGSLKK